MMGLYLLLFSRKYWLVERLVLWTCLLGLGFSSCPFQSPFYFVNSPALQPVLDEFGELIPDQIWVEFGPVMNHKCVDYYRVTYKKKDKSGITEVTSDRIGKYEPGAQMTVVPCTLYTFRIAAYEEFQGTGNRFKMFSNEVNFTLDYSPKFIKEPLVWEKEASPMSRVRNPREIHPYSTTTPRPTTEPFLIVTTVWDLTYIDFPICLDRVEFQYENIQWEESSFKEVFDDPKHRMSFVVSNKQLPCDEEFIFIAKVYGVNGDYTNTTWYPPSCVSTTPPPTTEGPTPPEFERCHPGASFVFLSIFCYDY